MSETNELIRQSQHASGAYAPEIVAPLFILAPPRSFTSIICAMLGQHPQMYGLPELELFGAETMAEWWDLCARATFPRAHGALRTVAQLYFGEQTETTVKLAEGWLRRRSHFTTGFLLEVLAKKVHPRILVEKSTSNVYSLQFLRRAHRMFPHARYIHLVRHPRGYGESVMKFLREREKLGPLQASHWIIRLASFPDVSRIAGRERQRHARLDPQHGWYALHMNICEFLKSVPDSQKLRIRGEEVLRDPNRGLQETAAWMGLRTDDEAIEEMKHPEQSPYACLGPRGARYGNDQFFLERPMLRASRAEVHSLEGPLSWREDGEGFVSEVKELAEQFGYE
jgi:hypothetical protein